MRINFWVSLVVFVLSVGFFVWWQFVRASRRRRRAGGETAADPTGRAMAVPKGRVR